jgi:hypothetical protein
MSRPPIATIAGCCTPSILQGSCVLRLKVESLAATGLLTCCWQCHALWSRWCDHAARCGKAASFVGDCAAGHMQCCCCCRAGLRGRRRRSRRRRGRCSGPEQGCGTAAGPWRPCCSAAPPALARRSWQRCCPVRPWFQSSIIFGQIMVGQCKSIKLSAKQQQVGQMATAPSTDSRLAIATAMLQDTTRICTCLASLAGAGGAVLRHSRSPHAHRLQRAHAAPLRQQAHWGAAW